VPSSVPVPLGKLYPIPSIEYTGSYTIQWLANWREDVRRRAVTAEVFDHVFVQARDKPAPRPALSIQCGSSIELPHVFEHDPFQPRRLAREEEAEPVEVPTTVVITGLVDASVIVTASFKYAFCAPSGSAGVECRSHSTAVSP